MAYDIGGAVTITQRSEYKSERTAGLPGREERSISYRSPRRR